MALLEISDLAVSFDTRRGRVPAVRGVDLSVARGEIVGLVGESGSGKSVTSYATMRLLDRGGHVERGGIVYAGMDLLTASERDMRDIRGREISMVFQNPRAALNPIRKVGKQIADALRQHVCATRQTARARAVEALEAVGIGAPDKRCHAYPFELSGGMCQRVVIALALACDPKLLIADEPTTGLDVTTQKAVMDLIARLIREREMSSVVITHDLALAAAYCDRIVVMRHGEVVESGGAAALFANPRHAYTQRLMQATPRPGVDARGLLPEASAMPARSIDRAPLLEVAGLTKTFPGDRGDVRAVDDLSFDVARGETLGLVGESGCGKSTTASMLVRLLDPSSGTIRFDGEDIAAIEARDFPRHPKRPALQMVFQDAGESLNPRHRARDAIAEPLMHLGDLARRQRGERVAELADLVGLPHDLLDRFPHQLSGGQKARVGIARAIALDPKLLVLDEPTAALDVSIQALVLNLLVDLRARLSVSYLFVSHDLQVVRLLCDRVLVMKDGRLLESGETETVMQTPQHAYTRSLLQAAPQVPLRVAAQ
jgi:peptide/nickel transport system ATP-binding protein